MSNRASKEVDLEAEREETRLREQVGGARARMAQVMRPTGKTFRRTSDYHDLGDGDRCPVEGHGKMYVINGHSWCPNQSHDAERVKETNNG